MLVEVGISRVCDIAATLLAERPGPPGPTRKQLVHRGAQLDTAHVPGCATYRKSNRRLKLTDTDPLSHERRKSRHARTSCCCWWCS